jgi:hypothetical protein
VIYSDSDSTEAQNFKENFKHFEGMIVKDFFIGLGYDYLETVGSGILSILTEDRLIIYRYRFAQIQIEFTKDVVFNLKSLNMDLTELRNVFYLKTECFLILKNGFYKLTQKPKLWEQQFYDKFDINGATVELKDIDATITLLNGCISIKGFGLVFFDLLHDDFKTFKVFEHKHIIGIATSGHSVISTLEF